MNYAARGFSNFGWFGLNCPDSYDIKPTSAPDYDVWGPDGCHWGPQDWIKWHQVMVTAYGKPEADTKWAAAYDKSTYGASEIGYSTGNPEFKAYVLAQGLQNKSTILSKVYKAETALNAVGEPVRNLGEAINNVTKTAATTTEGANTVAKWLPWIVLGGILLVGYIIYSNKSLKVV